VERPEEVPTRFVRGCVSWDKTAAVDDALRITWSEGSDWPSGMTVRQVGVVQAAARARHAKVVVEHKEGKFVMLLPGN
jgi:hypothetical protein